MRLLTHHQLICNVRACVATASRDPEAGPLNYPLEIKTTLDHIQVVETEFSLAFMKHLLETIDWKALHHTVNMVNILTNYS